jgi:N-hydroxyarylamine O-acetyltransferase
MTSKRGWLAEAPDLDAYFRRIGYAGPRTATLDTLAALHRLHPQAIPFENLDPLLQRPVTLNAAAFEQKMLLGGRGGWCFEHNLLFGCVLVALGFRVTGYAARVLWGVPEGATRARTHMLLGVECTSADSAGEGADAQSGAGAGQGRDERPSEAASTFIADVGFGGLTLTGPLRLVAGLEQVTPHEKFRLLEAGRSGFVLEVLLRGAWKPVYSFDLQPQVLADYELSNWYLSHFPESPFMKNLMAARVTPDRRYALFNNRLATHHLNGETEQVTLGSVGELRRVLEGELGIVLPDDAGLDAVLERFAAP